MPRSNDCVWCGNEIKIQCRKGTGLCCENCEKASRGETVAPDIESEGHHASE